MANTTIMEEKPSTINLTLLDSVGDPRNTALTVEDMERQGEEGRSCFHPWPKLVTLGLIFTLLNVLLTVGLFSSTCLSSTTAAPYTNPEHPTSTLDPSTFEPSTIEPSTLELIWNISDTAMNNMDPALQQRINEQFRRQEEELKKTEECRPVLVNVAVKSLLSPHDSLLDELYLQPENVAIYQCSGCDVGGCTGEQEGWYGVCGGDGFCAPVADLEQSSETTSNGPSTTLENTNSRYNTLTTNPSNATTIPATKTIFLKTIHEGYFHVHIRDIPQHNRCGCRLQ